MTDNVTHLPDRSSAYPPMPVTVEGFLRASSVVLHEANWHAASALALEDVQPVRAMFHQSLAFQAAERLQGLSKGLVDLLSDQPKGAA